MSNYNEIDGDLVKLAQAGKFDVIAHGCNVFCTMGAGIAPQMAKAFQVDKLIMEREDQRGNIEKLGNIDYGAFIFEGELKDVNDDPLVIKAMYKALLKYTTFEKDHKYVIVVNAYTQYNFDRNSSPVDYDAIALCFKKMNHIFKGKHIGLPWIGCGLAGGDTKIVKKLILTYLKDCKVTVVNYKK